MNKTSYMSYAGCHMVKLMSGVVLGAISLSAQSALIEGQTVMSIETRHFIETGLCTYDPSLTDGICYLPEKVLRGSYFTMGRTDPATTSVSLTGYDGILLGQGQPAGTGSHGGTPLLGDSGAVTTPWNYFGQTGHEFTANSGVTVASESGSTATLDFSNWRVTWNGIPEINMGGSPKPEHGDTGLASVSCWSDNTLTIDQECGYGAFYVLDYAAFVPPGDPSGFGGVPYDVHLEGIISSTVPVPAAFWLFGSGLLGLISVARCKSNLD